MTQILKTSRLARWIVGVLAGSLAMLPAFAAEPNVVVNKVRPIDSATNDVIYAPVVGFNGNFNTPPTSRLNMDLWFTNMGTTPVHLSNVRISYGNAFPEFQVSGDEYLINFPFTQSKPKPLLMEGEAWGTTGAVIQEDTKWIMSPFVASGFHDVDTELSGNNFIVGEYESEEGSWPYIAKYDRSGTLADDRVTAFGQKYHWEYKRANAVKVVPANKVLVGGGTGDAGPYPDRFAFTLFKNDLGIDYSFGFLGEKFVELPSCTETEVIDVSDYSYFGTYYTGVGPADCGGERKIGVVRLEDDGDLDTQFAGEGYLTLGFPGNVPVRPVAVQIQQLKWDLPPSIFIGAQVGEGCFSLSGECYFGVAKLDWYTGELDPMFGAFNGWALTFFPNASRQKANAMAIDSQNRIILAGSADVPDSRFALARFTPQGYADETFGDKGLKLYEFPEGRSAIYDVIAHSSGMVVATGWGTWFQGNIQVPVFATAAFNDNGSLAWWRSYSEGAGAVASGIAEDDMGRILVVGNHDQKFASIRLLSNGAYDSLAWLAPGIKRKLLVPEDRYLPNPAPPEVKVELFFEGYADPIVEERFLTKKVGLMVGPPGYRFPAGVDDLDNDERWSTGGNHWLGSDHRRSDTQRFAYDLGVRRWSGKHKKWVTTKSGASKPYKNNDYLIWGKKVRAMADGTVISCAREVKENEVGVRGQGGGNHLWIQHGPEEFALYAHMMYKSIDEELCPDPFPEQGVPVVEGQQLGLVGNTGRSTGPHLHVHLQDAASSSPRVQGIPLLFRDTLAIQGAAAVPYLGESYPWELFNPNDNNSPLWATVWGLSIGRSMLIVPPPAP